MRTSFDITKVAAVPACVTSRAIVDFLFDFSKPKFLFDDIYHFSGRHYQKHKNNRNMLPVVKLMLSTILNYTIEQSQPLLFVPEVITNGPFYYDRAEKHEQRIRKARGGDLVTYRMGEILNKIELDDLTDKNKNRAMPRLEGFQKQFPGTLAISPTGMEAMLQCLAHEPGFRNRQMLRDEDFEAFWIAMCMATQIGGFSDDVAYSRNGNFETFALFLVQYGVIPFRPSGDMEIFFPNRKPVTPFDYLQMIFSHMMDVVPRGFTTDLSVKMAVRMMMLEEMRTKKMVHPEWGALDLKKVNPKLTALGYTHTKDFDILKREVLMFMVEHNLGKDLGDKYGLAGYDGLEQYYHEKIHEVGPMIRGLGRPLREAYAIRNADNLDMDSALQKMNLINSPNFQIPYQLDGDFFSSAPPVFDEKHFERCTYVEQLALRTFMGLIETPKDSPKERFQDQGNVLLLIDRRGGEAAKEYGWENGCALPSESRGLSSSFELSNFEEAVKNKNITKTLEHAEFLRAIYPESIISTLEDIERDFENFREHRSAFVAQDHLDRLSPIAKLAYGEERLTRSTKLAVFDVDWENSSLLLGLRLQARKIQLGLIDRPKNMPPYSMIVGNMADNGDGYITQSLADDLKTLTSYMENLVEAGTEDIPRPLVKALLETVLLVRCYYAEQANKRAGHGEHGLIDWQSVPMAGKARLESDKPVIREIASRAKELLINHGMNALSLNDVIGDLEEDADGKMVGKIEKIDPDYKTARKNLDAQQLINQSKKARSGSYQRGRGFNAA